MSFCAVTFASSPVSSQNSINQVFHRILMVVSQSQSVSLRVSWTLSYSCSCSCSCSSLLRDEFQPGQGTDAHRDNIS